MIVLSASGWITYKQCPKKYEYSKVKRIKTDIIEDHSYAVPGSTTHMAAEQYLKTFDDTCFSLDAVRAIFDELKKDPRHNLDNYPGGENKAWEMTKTCAKNLHMFLLGQDLKGKKFYTEFNIGSWNNPCEVEDLRFMGAADLLVPAFDKYVLYDYKATYQRKNVDPDQLKVYKISVEKLLGVKVSLSGFFFLPLSLPQYYSFPDEEMEIFKDKIRSAVVNIEKGIFEKKPSVKCDNCMYRELCKPEAKTVAVSNTHGDFEFFSETPIL